MSHLGGDQRGGRLRGDQQPEPGRGRPGPAIRASWSACTSATACGGSVGPTYRPAAAPTVGTSSNRVAAAACSAGSGGSGGTSSPARLAQAAATACGSPQRPSCPSSSASTSARSWQRAGRTPAASSRGYSRRVSGQTQRGASRRSRSATAAGSSAAVSSAPGRSACVPSGDINR